MDPDQDERAAIVEYLANVPRQLAERLADERRDVERWQDAERQAGWMQDEHKRRGLS